MFALEITGLFEKKLRDHREEFSRLRRAVGTDRRRNAFRDLASELVEFRTENLRPLISSETTIPPHPSKFFSAMNTLIKFHSRPLSDAFSIRQ